METSHEKIIILGSDSSVGSKVFAHLRRLKADVYGTTRRASHSSDRTMFLDLLDPKSWKAALELAPAAVIAFSAVSDLAECETNPQSASINVQAVPDLLNEFGLRGSRAVLLSTNSVFGGDREKCNEDATPSPALAYAIQKVDAEHRFFAHAEKGNYSNNTAVVRLTRVLTTGTQPIPSWLDALNRGQNIEAFTDFIFSPVSQSYVGNSLLQIVNAKQSGCFHLSGSRDISYYEFARLLANRVNPESTVLKSSASEKGLTLLFKPTYSALGMSRTTRHIGIKPQRPEQVVEELSRSDSSQPA